MNPGATTLPAASISVVPVPWTVPIAMIRPPRIATSPATDGLPDPSITRPWRITTSYSGGRVTVEQPAMSSVANRAAKRVRGMTQENRSGAGLHGRFGRDIGSPFGFNRVMAKGPTFGEALRFWLKLGFISFGGPTGQIAVMHTELVERKRWVGEEQFLHALNYCMLLPGPEATQLATYCGWLLHGTRGGIVAGALFVLPGAFVLWVLSWVYATHGTVPWIAAVFHGLKAAVTAIVLAAVIRIGRRALRDPFMWLLA